MSSQESDSEMGRASTSDIQVYLPQRTWKRNALKFVCVVSVMAVLVVGVAIATLSSRVARLAVPDQATVRFTANWNNVNGASEYRGHFHKGLDSNGQWTLDGKFWFFNPLWNTTTTVSLLDSRVYRVETKLNGELLSADCLNEGGPMPDDASMQAAYNSAVLVEKQDVSEFPVAAKLDCTAGTWLLTLSGDQFAFCDPTRASTNLLAPAIAGTDFIATLTDVKFGSFATPVVDSIPLGEDGTALQCEPIASLEQRSLQARRLQRSARRTTIQDRSSLPLSATTTQRCIFLHDAGQPTSSAATSQDTGNWGNVHNYATGCSSTTFLHMNTVDSTWEDPSLQDAFCAAAVNGVTSGAQTIANTKVFTVGFSGLLVAAAILNNKCDFTSTSYWFTIGVPVDGGHSYDVLSTYFCGYYDDGWMNEINNVYHLCSGSGSSRTLNPGYASMMTTYSPTTTTMAEVITTMTARVSGSVCGTDSYGLDATTSSYLQNLADQAGLGQVNNDGLLRTTSCRNGANDAATALGMSFQTSYVGYFYKPQVNHLDIQCKYGDGVYNYRKPCSWFQFR